MFTPYGINADAGRRVYRGRRELLMAKGGRAVARGMRDAPALRWKDEGRRMKDDLNPGDE